MRARTGILIVLLAAGLTACSSSSNDTNSASSDPTRLSVPSASVTEVKLDCANFSDVASKIIQAQTKIYTPGNEAAATAAVDDLKAELNGLKDGAPADVVAALDDLSAAYDQVIEAIKHPTSQAQANLATLGAKLSEDGQKITTYIVSKCTG